MVYSFRVLLGRPVPRRGDSVYRQLPNVADGGQLNYYAFMTKSLQTVRQWSFSDVSSSVYKIE